MRYTVALTSAWCMLAFVDHGKPSAQPLTMPAFSCEATFAPDLNVTDLERRFGTPNVKSAGIYLGEGFTEPGTVLFPDQPANRVDIVWRESTRQQAPAWIRIRGTRSNWRTPQGLTLGSDLKTIERVNGTSFRILSFDVDKAGTVLSWSGGLLEQKSAAGCATVVRLMPKPYSDPDAPARHWYQELVGIDAFSSAHPAAQALNPTAYEVRLVYQGSPR